MYGAYMTVAYIRSSLRARASEDSHSVNIFAHKIGVLSKNEIQIIIFIYHAYGYEYSYEYRIIDNSLNFNNSCQGWTVKFKTKNTGGPVLLIVATKNWPTSYYCDPNFMSWKLPSFVQLLTVNGGLVLVICSAAAVDIFLVPTTATSTTTSSSNMRRRRS